ncbi:MAG: hypothetical protein KQH53_16900 [Desulfarculaceae bacterium]|nr:hypothetical protein [Desulfarculaceae bacterium]
MQGSLRRYWLALAGLAVFVVINAATLHGGHPAGGDFAQYIIHAKNLLSGQPYDAGIFLPQVHFHNYPPGYPLMLAPLLAWGGLNLVLFKSLNLIFWPLACAALAAIARRRLGSPTDIYFFLFLLFVPWFFLFKQDVLSDVPFTCVASVALWAFLRWQDEGPRRAGWLSLFLACLFVSLLLRSAGVALVGAALLVMVFQRRAWGAAGLTIAAAVAAVLVQKLMAAGTGGYLSMLLNNPAYWLDTVVRGLPAKVAKAVAFFIPVYRSGWPLLAALEALAVLPLIAVSAWGWLRRRRRAGGWDVLDAYLVLYLLMILAWPFVEGPRFYAPAIGILVIYFLEGLSEFAAGRAKPGGRSPAYWVNLALMAGLALNLGNTALLWNYQDDVVLRPADRELYAWVREHALPGETYLFSEPRVMALFTGKVGDKYYWNQPLGPQEERMAARGVRWLILHRPEAARASARKQYAWIFLGGGKKQPGLAQAEADPQLRPVWQNRGYKIFALKGRDKADER